MNCKIFNEDNLKENEIDGEVVRVKAFIINSKNEIMLASSNGGVQLVGGHVENDEQKIEALKREIKEEAGIDISSEEISEPFYEVRHYIRNYFDSSKNIVAKMFYYIIKTDKVPNLDNTHLTEQEKDCKFNLKLIPYDSFAEYVKGFLNNEQRVNELIANEILSAFKELSTGNYF